MKIYISADIEGVTGCTHWDETEKSKPDYGLFLEQMTREVKAACEGAINAGAKEIWIKDAHDSARNMDFSDFPVNIRFIRGWSGHPFVMMQEIDSSFDGAIMIGYHAHAGAGANPLSHTLDSMKVNYIKINDELADELLVNSYTSYFVNVPVVFVSGDEGVCSHAQGINHNIKTAAVKKGIGNSTISIHPKLAVQMIKEGVEEALKENLDQYLTSLPEKFKVEISFVHHFDAYKASFYPGMKQIADQIVVFETNDYFDVLKMLKFVV
jgi:D-amino peptidase